MRVVSWVGDGRSPPHRPLARTLPASRGRHRPSALALAPARSDLVAVVRRAAGVVRVAALGGVVHGGLREVVAPGDAGPLLQVVLQRVASSTASGRGAGRRATAHTPSSWMARRMKARGGDPPRRSVFPHPLHTRPPLPTVILRAAMLDCPNQGRRSTRDRGASCGGGLLVRKAVGGVISGTTAQRLPNQPLTRVPHPAPAITTPVDTSV